MCMCKYICFIFSTLQNAFSFITIFYHTPTLHCFIWMNIHKNVMISNITFIQLVSYHWTLYLDVASSIQFPPHYTFSIFFTIQLKRMLQCFLLVDLSSVVFFRLSNTALILLQEFSGLSRKAFTTWGDFYRSLSALSGLSLLPVSGRLSATDGTGGWILASNRTQTGTCVYMSG